MIRRADKNDIGRIMELLQQVALVHNGIRPDLFRPHTTKYSEEELEELLLDNDKPVFVYDDGELLGHAFCMVEQTAGDRLLYDRKTLYIDDICVDEKARGRHIGQALYEFVREYAVSIGCDGITLNVWEGNAPAMSFYRNMGMQVRKTTMEVIL